MSTLHEVLEAYVGGTDHPGAQPVTFGDVSKTANGQAYLDAHTKADALDPRHKDPNSSVDMNTGNIYISKFPYNPAIPAKLNPELLLFNAKN